MLQANNNLIARSPLKLSTDTVSFYYASITMLLMMRPLTDVYLTFVGIDLEFIMIGLVSIPFLIWLLKRPQRALTIIFKDKVLTLAYTLALLSVLWSIDPMRSVIGLFNLMLGTLFAVYLVLRFRLKTIIWIFGFALIMAVILSILVSVGIPEVGQRRGAGEWQGGFGHKNTLGRYMMLGAVTFWVLRKSQGYRRSLFAWIGVVSTFALLFLSGSTTSAVSFLVIGFISTCLIIFIRFRSRTTLKFFFAILIGVSLLSLAFTSYIPDLARILFAFIGRNPNFTTIDVRLELWDFLFNFFKQRPLLGHGYDAFWTASGRAVPISLGNIRWTVYQAHNGFFELALQLGLVGLILAVLHLIITARLIINIIVQAKLGRIEGLWMISIFGSMIILNMTYSAIFGQLTVLWILYLIVAFAARGRKLRLIDFGYDY